MGKGERGPQTVSAGFCYSVAGVCEQGLGQTGPGGSFWPLE